MNGAVGSRESGQSGLSPASRRRCTLDGCERPHKARGWCRAHYNRERAKVDAEFREARRERWRRKAARRKARLAEQAAVYRELLERGDLP